jgi:cytochrome P450
VFDHPDTLDVTRTPKPHLSFGFGAHHCLGAALARMEAVAVIRTLSQRFPDVELAQPDKIVFNANRLLRGVTELPIRLGRERTA